MTSTRAFRSNRSARRYDHAEGTVEVDPSEVVDQIKNVGSDLDHDHDLNDELPEMELPGHGPRLPDCGDDIPRFCGDCGHVNHVGRTCRRSECPRCWAAWDRERATTIGAKLEALRRYKESQSTGWDGYKFHHVILSPPDGFSVNAEDPYQATVDLLKDVLSTLGVDTGVLFHHPYRGEDGDDRGFWKHILPDGEDKAWLDTRDELSHSPHFHGVVLAKQVPGGMVSKEIEEKTGWIIDRITKNEESNVSIYDKYDLARVLTYCLSHTGIRHTHDENTRNRAAYGYFGEVHNFVADDQIKAEIDAATRSVAPRTLDLPYDSLACNVEREITETSEVKIRQKVNAARAGAGAGGEPDEAVMVEERERTHTGDCEGRLLSITKAPRFVKNEDWLADAPHSMELIEAWYEWRDKVDGDDPPD